MPKVRTLVTRWLFKGDTKKLKQFNRGLSLAKRGAMVAAKGVAYFAGGVGAATVAVAGLTRATASSAIEIDKWAQRLDVPVDKLSQLKFVAEQNNAEFDDLTDTIKEFSVKAFDAADGSKDLRRIFNELGVSIKDDTGKMRPALELFTDTALAIGRMEDSSRQFAIADMLASDAAVRLIPMFKSGRVEIEAMMQQAKELGISLGKDDVKAAKDFTRSLGGLKASVKGVAMSLGRELLPVAADYLKQAQAWVKNNRELIKERLDKAVKALAGGLRKVDWRRVAREGADAARALVSILKAAAALLDKLGGLKFLFGVVFGAATLNGIMAIVGAVKALAEAFATGMVGAAAIAGLIGVLVALGAYMYANWEDIADQWRYLWLGMVEVVKDAVGWIGDMLDGISDWFDALPGHIKRGLGKAGPLLMPDVQVAMAGAAAGPAGGGGVVNNSTRSATMGGVTVNNNIQGGADRAAVRQVERATLKSIEQANRALMEGVQR